MLATVNVSHIAVVLGIGKLVGPECASTGTALGMFTRSLYQTEDMIRQHHLLEHVSALIDEGIIKTTVGEHFDSISASNLKRAHALIESGKAKGKVAFCVSLIPFPPHRCADAR